MEAPEKVHVFVYHNEDLEVYEMPLKTLNGTLITVEYTRSDLCTMPGELVERLKEFQAAVEGWRECDHPEWFCRRTAEYVAELGRSAAMAWHEGRKG